MSQDRTETLCDAALDAMPQAVVVVDDRRRIVLVNHAAVRLLQDDETGIALGDDIFEHLARLSRSGHLATAPGLSPVQTVTDIRQSIETFRPAFDLHFSDGRSFAGQVAPMSDGRRLLTLTASDQSSSQSSFFRHIENALAGSGIGLLVFAYSSFQIRFSCIISTPCIFITFLINHKIF